MRNVRVRTRDDRFTAIFASILMCAVIPAAAGTRPQTSSTGTTTAKSAPKSPAHKTSSAAKKTATATHRTAPGTTHKNTSASAKKSAAHHTTRPSSRKTKTTRVRGQQKIDSERATSIQQALVREHYLNGEPSGVWDTESEAAMRRYQSDHGWQTKEVPDSRALIKLGLGPNNDHLLNPESAMTSTPIAQRSASPTTGSHPATPIQPTANAGDPPPTEKPATVNQTTPSGQPVPSAPPKTSDDSGKPQ